MGVSEHPYPLHRNVLYATFGKWHLKLSTAGTIGPSILTRLLHMTKPSVPIDPSALLLTCPALPQSYLLPLTAACPILLLCLVLIPTPQTFHPSFLERPMLISCSGFNIWGHLLHTENPYPLPVQVSLYRKFQLLQVPVSFCLLNYPPVLDHQAPFPTFSFPCL